ncbi:MAG: tRNA threonylcarbamoyladenosine dehydratase [Firmicutes bacterium]|nr:tRNA threonylcarbamoyladenosine dehydratase [Bacillota bacterium]
MNRFIRTEIIIGKAACERLSSAKVIVFGVGGVGSFVCEGLARAGIGEITLVDNDTVSESNINRQLVALTSTIGKYKTEIMADRIHDINPECCVKAFTTFYTKEKEVNISGYNYVIDAIDTVSSKLVLIEEAQRLNIPIISCMGTGNKLDPTKFKISDIYKTSVCPLARVMRRELHARNIKRLKVLYSTENAIKPKKIAKENPTKRQTPGSISFVPSVAGMIIAGEVIKDLIK